LGDVTGMECRADKCGVGGYECGYLETLEEVCKTGVMSCCSAEFVPKPKDLKRLSTWIQLQKSMGKKTDKE
jgi:hypothetical protein